MNYYIRLDDACERRDVELWNRMELMLDTYNIKPLVGVIPQCEDTKMDKYNEDTLFWERVEEWVRKGWSIALHGYSHVCETEEGGINPVNKRSEFAGVSLEAQKEKIRKGMEIFRLHGIVPQVFFAPSHTFDENTIEAIKQCSEIRIISDTIASRPYNKQGITFVPQQSGQVRWIPLNSVTFCYHPNTMQESDFQKLEHFIKKYRKHFRPYVISKTERKMNWFDKVLQHIYFLRR